MPRPKNASPSYLLHKPTGQARIRLRKGNRYQDYYLGEYGSTESLEKYHRILAEHFGTGENGQSSLTKIVPVIDKNDWSIATLLVKYDDFATRHYRKNGEPTDDRYRAAIPPLVELYGSTLARDFGPIKFKALREYIIQRGNMRSAELDAHGNLIKPGKPLGRGYVNNLMKSVVRIFKWAVTEEKVPPSVPDALVKVGGLRKGREPRVKEPKAIKPVEDENFWPVVHVAPPQIATMLQVQRLTGMRPDEITIMSSSAIDQRGQIWIYRPNSHKLEWLDQEKEVFIGPQAQQLLIPWIKNRQEQEYLFSPREVAVANAKALEKRRKRPSAKGVGISKKRPPRAHYDDRGYRQVVIRACQRAGIPLWSPGQLRHTTATKIRARFGAEAAQLVLGHKNLSTTEIYAEKNRTLYAEIMQQIG
jgi:integrase